MQIGRNYAFKRAYDDTIIIDYNHEYASTKGIGLKTGLLLLITFITSLFMIGLVLGFGALYIIPYVIAGIASLVLQLVIMFNPAKTKYLAIPYAISEGILIGCVCGILEFAIPGYGLAISCLALLTTLAIFVGASFLYGFGIIKVGRGFYNFLMIVSIGILFTSFAFAILSLICYFLLNINLISIFYFSSFGLIIAVIMCIIAALYVISSLSLADNLIKAGADKKMEWYAAYAITLNVIYLFLEVLRLLIILFGNRRRN